MFVNFGYVGGESVYSGLSANIGKRTQENASPRDSTSAIFVNVPRCIMFYRLFIGNLTTHTKDPPTDTRHIGGRSSLFRGGGSGVFLHASALFRYVRVYIGSNSA